MGVLYRARDTRLGRTVAIKVLRAETVADAARTKRFVQEARAASSLNHPNIVTVYDIGEDPTRGTYIAMECVEGESLKQRLARGPLPLDEALRVATDIARGLAAAHAAGIVHRDVKPANVMLASSGAVKILDFGLAKLFQPEPSTGDAEAPTAEAMTAHGLLLGTPAYMSPEQAEGRPLDARSDVFSFGALLYELLTGRRAFEGKTALSLVTSILRDTPPPPRSLRPEIASRLEAIVNRCLQKDPAARYPSAEALVHDLEAARAAGEKPRRSRAAWLVSAVLLLVVGRGRHLVVATRRAGAVGPTRGAAGDAAPGGRRRGLGCVPDRRDGQADPQGRPGLRAALGGHHGDLDVAEDRSRRSRGQGETVRRS